MVYVNIFAYFEGRGGENGKVICENRSYGYGISSELLSTCNYDAYEEPVEIRSLEEGAVVAISVAVITGVCESGAESSGDHDHCGRILRGKFLLRGLMHPYLQLCSQERQQVCSAGACRQEAGEAADGAP